MMPRAKIAEIEAAVAEEDRCLRRTHLGDACAKLDPTEERALAEEAADLAEWPEY